MEEITNKSQRRIRLRNHYKNIVECLLKVESIDVIIDLIIEYIKNEPINNGKLTASLTVVGSIHLLLPYGIAYNENYIYINNSGFNEVVVIDENRNFIKCWGKFGKENGEFYNIRNSVICESYIYIADLKNGRIQVFNILDGKFVTSIKHNCTSWGVYVYESLIYVCSIDADSISVYTNKGDVIKEIEIDKPKQKHNTGVAADRIGPTNLIISDDDIYIVGTTCNMILCLSIKGEYKFGLNGKDTGGREFYKPCSIYLSDDSLYVGDKHGIQQFNRNNNFSFVKKFLGSNDGSYSITFVGNTCYSTDFENNKLNIFE